jgi:nitrile hydratase
LALTLAMGASGAWNIDMSRAARESLADYARLSYYEIWIAALERLLLQRGLVEREELRRGVARPTTLTPPRVLKASEVTRVLAAGAPTARAATSEAAYAVGQRVRTRAQAVPHHSRLPAYVRGRCGVVERLHGMHVFADAHAQGLGEQPQWLYTVVFDSTQLWDDAGGAPHRVSVDAWESYLEAA